MWRKLWFNENIEQKIGQIIRANIAQIDAGTGLCIPPNVSMEYDTNWLFAGHTVAQRDCYLWHTIMFNFFDLVPKFCKFNCWKVVVKPRTFAEAWQFYNLLSASATINGDLCDLQGKCGIDSRFYTNSPWGGFVYCTTKEEALEKYLIVQQMINSYIPDGGNIPIIVKRSCTEFERKYGATDGEFWSHITPEEHEMEARLRDIFVGHWSPSVQPDWLKNKTIYKWAKWANTIGDKSHIEVFGKDLFTMSAVTYHQLINNPDKEKSNGSS